MKKNKIVVKENTTAEWNFTFTFNSDFCRSEEARAAKKLIDQL